MFRKVTLGLIAAASLGAAALTPSAASAHGWHIGGWHGGWGGYGHHAFYGGPTFYVGGLTDGCLQRRVVETRRGPRVRTVNVCAY
ncbi:hypothetical protein SAMN03159423_2424 [Bradyrhizobium sp. NFR13]|jgi:hypothetical protein|uniref:hypothetical protein n=1 Tax=Bradyrhizobium sp. NFR13 TaxID=1566285 RepID=UPI0008EB4A27|nr:hypothetical protein [Bradyrhizobium sp. NFR13]SFL55198.1 hypothetical protein SAMN03159423_2424 [Bradyrhizobium sp. NFR13]